MNQFPLARKDHLVIRDLADEVLIYDLARNKALCLNRTAGAVWKRSNGHNSARQIAQDVSHQLGATINEEAVWTVLGQLGRDQLLEFCVSAPSHAVGVTRREQLKSFGRAAAMGAPLVATLAIPKNALAAGSCVPAGGNCGSGASCCPNSVCKYNKGRGSFCDAR